MLTGAGIPPPCAMSSGAWVMASVVLLAVATLGFLIYSAARSMRDESDRRRSRWREFGLSIALLILFLASWVGQAITEWQVFTDHEHAEGRSPAIGDFLAEFGQSTFENWQSEFLQLFAFVVLAALYIHKGSAESKDSGDRLEASLRRIEDRLGTLPPTAPQDEDARWRLPDTSLEVGDR